MSDHHEPSYYEIALTNRQVLGAFVVVLACVLTAFVAGVWVGRDATPPAADSTVAAEESRLDDLERLDFFAADGGSSEPGSEVATEPRSPSRRPDLESLLAKPASDSTLAEDVGARQKPRRPRREEKVAEALPVDPLDEPAPRRRTAPPNETSDEAPDEAPVPETVPSPPTAGDGYVIQVFSSRDSAKAESVVAELGSGGHRAFLSPVEVGSQTMYRVRIGPFRDRAGAEKAAIEVNRDFKLDTWVTAAGAGD